MTAMRTAGHGTTVKTQSLLPGAFLLAYLTRAEKP